MRIWGFQAQQMAEAVVVIVIAIVAWSVWAATRSSPASDQASGFPDTAPMAPIKDAPENSESAASPADWYSPSNFGRLSSGRFTAEQLAEAGARAQAERDAVQARLDHAAEVARENAAQAATQLAALTDRTVSTSTPEPPAAVYGRWHMVYRTFGEGGELLETRRTVRILEVRPNLYRLVCWCELRQAVRTFNFGSIVEVVDADTGEHINWAEWLTAYRRSRRRPR